MHILVDGVQNFAHALPKSTFLISRTRHKMVYGFVGFDHGD
jgi:hypothetical protein